ncbi:MAG: hypothetical protein PHS57_04720 [Alphaproteobacteria bacterium]|nr:hypothetical protein [Alphaproteobacteria bacterium]
MIIDFYFIAQKTTHWRQRVESSDIAFFSSRAQKTTGRLGVVNRYDAFNKCIYVTRDNILDSMKEAGMSLIQCPGAKEGNGETANVVINAELVLLEELTPMDGMTKISFNGTPLFVQVPRAPQEVYDRVVEARTSRRDLFVASL